MAHPCPLFKTLVACETPAASPSLLSLCNAGIASNNMAITRHSKSKHTHQANGEIRPIKSKSSSAIWRPLSLPQTLIRTRSIIRRVPQSAQDTNLVSSDSHVVSRRREKENCPVSKCSEILATLSRFMSISVISCPCSCAPRLLLVVLISPEVKELPTALPSG